MCIECYIEFGSPSIKNDKVNQTVDLIRQIYSFSEMGGDLHSVLDDWNIEDYDLDVCGQIIDNGGEEWRALTKGQLLIEKECCALLRGMSMQERASALGLYYGFAST